MKFEEWCQTNQGRACLRWPIPSIQYLKNRLWWAFIAGFEAESHEEIEGNSEDDRQEPMP